MPDHVVELVGRIDQTASSTTSRPPDSTHRSSATRRVVLRLQCQLETTIDRVGAAAP